MEAALLVRGAIIPVVPAVQVQLLHVLTVPKLRTVTSQVEIAFVKLYSMITELLRSVSLACTTA